LYKYDFLFFAKVRAKSINSKFYIIQFFYVLNYYIKLRIVLAYS